MDIFTVSFFGHRKIDKPMKLEKELEKLVTVLLRSYEYVDFLVGRDGDFDLLVSAVIRRCKRQIREDNSSLVLVLPYMTAEFKNSQSSFLCYYDQVELCQDSANAHFKAAHQRRNLSMAVRSDFIVFYVEHEHGGAYRTMCQAQKLGKNIINLADTCFS